MHNDWDPMQLPTRHRQRRPSADASSASSYAPSQASSFTLSSTTDASSTSSGQFENRKRTSESSANSNAATEPLKQLYHEIARLEIRIKQDSSTGDADPNDRLAWDKRIQDHKKFVADIKELLQISLNPSKPASLRNIPTKYNLVNRLWMHGFSLLLESLRRAAFLPGSGAQNIALEHLMDFIFFAYGFYTAILEEPPMDVFRNGWLEALGDLARYKSMVESLSERSGQSINSVFDHTDLTSDKLSGTIHTTAVLDLQSQSVGFSHEATHMFQSSNISPAQSLWKMSNRAMSIGQHAAALLLLEPESERWRVVAREWYGMGLNDQPGTGRLHHYIGLLSRDATNNGDPRETLRTVYHFFKSLIAVHPFPLSQESLPSIFSPLIEQPSACSSPLSLFLVLHGMIYLQRNLDQFDKLLTTFLHSISNPNTFSERDWTMMAVINLAAILEHGNAKGILRMALGGVSATHTSDDQAMEIDEQRSSIGSSSLPLSFLHSLNLTCSLLCYTLEYPFLGNTDSVNPYITILLTFLVTILKTLTPSPLLDTIHHQVPWRYFAVFLRQIIPEHVWHSQKLLQSPTYTFRHCEPRERWPMLTSSTAPALPEDWCLRGSEWVGRRVYERGFWQDNGGDDEKISRVEIRYLYTDCRERYEGSSGRHFHGLLSADPRFVLPKPTRREPSPREVNEKRYIRILRCGVLLASLVPHFSWSEGTTDFFTKTIVSDYEMQVDD